MSWTCMELAMLAYVSDGAFTFFCADPGRGHPKAERWSGRCWRLEEGSSDSPTARAVIAATAALSMR